METNEPNKKVRKNGSGTYFIAAVFIVVGVLLLGKNLDLIDTHVYHMIVSWQTMLIAIGVFILTQKQNTAGGFILMAVGLYFLLPRMGLFDCNLDVIYWPSILIVIGFLLVFKTIRKKKGNTFFQAAYNQHISTDGFIVSENSFGTIQQIVSENTLRGGTIRNSFGSTIIDLRRTTLDARYTYIDVECSFGNVEFYIPSSWDVNTQLRPFMGGCEDSRLTGVDIDTSHTLIIKGNISFGGIEIKG